MHNIISSPAAALQTLTKEVTLPNAGRLIIALRQLGYSFEQAISDLIDNSINAGASTVLIRFLTDREKIRSVIIADNGAGMTESELAEAMRFGSERSPGLRSLGKYGMGLKLASFSHAQSLTVVSRRKGSCFGRGWTLAGVKRGWECEVFSPLDADEKTAGFWGPLRAADSGTLILWNEIDKLPASSRGLKTILRDLQRRLQTHLGLFFHRFLERGRLQILLDQQVLGEQEHQIRFEVRPLNPFAYPRSGSPDYPKTFEIAIQGVGTLNAVAHIWPPNSEEDEYRLERRAAARQGFYFYRNDRLIQAGGWNGLLQHETEPHNSLARVSIDLPLGLDTSFGLNVQKSAVIVPPGFIIAVAEAVAEDGQTFDSFRHTAQLIYRNQALQADKKLPLIPFKGLPVHLRQTVKKILSPDEEKVREVSFEWTWLDSDALFEIDREQKTIRFNRRYRKQILKGSNPDATNLPLLKLLIFFLVENDLDKDRVTAARRRRLDQINALLAEAAVLGGS